MDDNERNVESRIDDILGSVGHLFDSNSNELESTQTQSEKESITSVDDLLDIIREPDEQKPASVAVQADAKPENRIDSLLNDIGTLAENSDVKIQDSVTTPASENAESEEDAKITSIPPVLEKVEPVQENAIEEDGIEEYEEEPKKKSKALLVWGIVLLVIALLGGVYAFFSMPLSEAKKQEIYANGEFAPGVSVFDINVGGDTMEIAKNKLDGKVNLSGEQTLMQMRLKDQVINIKAADLNLTNTMDSVLKEAMLYGKQEHLIKRFWNLYIANKEGKNFDVAIYTDDASLQNLVQTIVTNYSVPAKDADAEINTEGEERFTFIDEVVGMQIREEGLAQRIKQHIEGKSSDVLELEYTETQPNITFEELKQNMVLRSTYSTNVSGATGRRKNIMLASSKINGKKVMPGETFNIENELGPRNAANGWSVGGEFVNGELVSGYGGGICQASTTLFNAVIRADLEVVERSNHSQTVGYVPLGFDAT
ncbi:MAG: VanW family protein, partial [Clostridia bacterium]|nr:VanW family protein [Clostridia bacterium]